MSQYTKVHKKFRKLIFTIAITKSPSYIKYDHSHGTDISREGSISAAVSSLVRVPPREERLDALAANRVCDVI